MFGANIKNLIKEGRQAWERYQELDIKRMNEGASLSEEEFKKLIKQWTFWRETYYDYKDQLRRLEVDCII